MAKKIFLIVLSSLLLSAGLLMAAASLKVRVKSTKLRRSPKFYASTMATLRYGESLEKLSQQDGWIQAKTSAGATGWIHSSAVTAPKFSLTAGRTAQEETSADEVALAGKGFNEQVEQEYRKSTELDYTWVDRMDQIKVTEAEMERFFREGKLGEYGGGK